MGNGSQDLPENLQPERESKFPELSRENSPRKKPGGNEGRLSRLLKIIDMLQSGRAYNSQDLAQLCGVSRRTVFRDIAALQDAGLSVLQDETQRGYFLPNRNRRPSTESTPTEALPQAIVSRDPQGPSEVIIHFAADIAKNVAEANWHPTQKTELLPDGRLELLVTVEGLEEISWWILGYGDRAEVIQPPELRDRLRQHAENMVRLYGSSAVSK